MQRYKLLIYLRKNFGNSGIFSIFAIPNKWETYFAVVVKWYTRYFEGVVGASPCEFDSHLPHERDLTDSVGSLFLFHKPSWGIGKLSRRGGSDSGNKKTKSGGSRTSSYSLMLCSWITCSTLRTRCPLWRVLQEPCPSWQLNRGKSLPDRSCPGGRR